MFNLAKEFIVQRDSEIREMSARELEFDVGV
jgi:hypothetical protein